MSSQMRVPHTCSNTFCDCRLDKDNFVSAVARPLSESTPEADAIGSDQMLKPLCKHLNEVIFQ